MIFQFVVADQIFGNAKGRDGFSFGVRASLKQAAVGTGFRHPGDFADIVSGQLQAFGNQCTAVLIFRTFAGFKIEVFADDVGVVYFAGVFILNFYQAAFAATIANGFPFFFRHVLQFF